MVRYSQITKCRKIYGTPGNRKAATGTIKNLVLQSLVGDYASLFFVLALLCMIENI